MVGGDFNNIGGIAARAIAEWDGTTWTARNLDLTAGSVYALARDSAGELYAGGPKFNDSDTGLGGVAHWNVVLILPQDFAEAERYFETTLPPLKAALEPYLASHNVEFGFARKFGRASGLHVAASYAPSEFVLGLPTSNSLRTPNDGGQIEYQLLWTTLF